MTLLIRKNYINKIFKCSLSGAVYILTGMRYSGKSTILKQFYKELQKQEIPENNIKFIDLAKNHDRDKNAQYLSELLDSLTRNSSEKQFLIIDNIEWAENWGHILYHRCKYQHHLYVYIAPKNSNYKTNDELGKVFGINIEIYPFSFNEFLEYNQLNNKEKIENTTEKELFKEYMNYGGIPEVVESENIERKRILIESNYKSEIATIYYETYFVYFVKRLIKYLIETSGEIFSHKLFQKFINKDARDYFGIYNLSRETLYNIISIINNMSLLQLCGVNKPSNEHILENCCYYVSDPSFYNLCPFLSGDSDKKLQSIVFTEFSRRDFPLFMKEYGDTMITFFNQKNNICIEVVNTLKDKKTRNKIFNKLKQTKNAKKYVISTDETNYDMDDIKHVNIIEFLKDEEKITNGVAWMDNEIIGIHNTISKFIEDFAEYTDLYKLRFYMDLLESEHLDKDNKKRIKNQLNREIAKRMQLEEEYIQWLNEDDV